MREPLYGENYGFIVNLKTLYEHYLRCIKEKNVRKALIVQAIYDKYVPNLDQIATKMK